MRSSFFGLNVGSQGLYTARTAMDITNHNISNAETVGYSRQYGIQQASRALPDSGRGMVGTGSEIINVGQQRNTYLDTKYWGMTKDLGEYTVKSEGLSEMELLFNEPSDEGFTATFDDMFQSLQTLSKNPSDYASRTGFIDSTVSFTKYINDISDQLRVQQREANFGIKTKVDEINFASAQLASLNDQIANLELTGNRANDLRDQRAVLVDKLSKIVNIEAKELTDANGKSMYRVTVDGQTLVEDNVANALEVKPRTTLDNPEDNVDLYDIYWKAGQKMVISDPTISGELKGYIDLRDGNNGQNFEGTVSSGVGTTTIVVSNPSRTDMPASGKIFLNGSYVNYSNAAYDSATNQYTFTLASNCPAGTTTCRIGEDMSFKGIPYYRQQLDEFVRTIARAFNSVHQQGDNNTGQPLFTYTGYTGTPALNNAVPSSYDAMTIDNFQFNPAIEKNVSLLKTKFQTADGQSNNDLLLKMDALRHDSTLFAKGEADNFIQSVFGELGIDAKQVNSFKTGQEHLTLLVQNQRLSVSGVDVNEETTNMLKYQQAYNMSAKIISVMNAIYDVTINGMGIG